MKRQNNDGNIRKRGQHSWEGSVMIEGTRHYVYGRSSQEVRKRISALTLQSDLGLFIDESDMLEKLQNGYDIVSTAASLDVNVNLLAIKLAEMNKHGLPVGVPFIPDRKFMGRIMDCADSY